MEVDLCLDGNVVHASRVLGPWSLVLGKVPGYGL